MRSFDTLARDLEWLRDYLAEEISREDMEHHEGLRRIVLAADDIANRVSRRDLEWTKTR